MAEPHLYLLGGFDFAGAGVAAPAFGRKARAMVAYLALQSGHSQSREKIAALLWGINSEAQARTSLRQAVSSARKAMNSSGRRLVADGDQVALDLEGLDFDVARFETLAASPEAGDLEQALETYRGDLLDGFTLREEPFEDWLRVERERLRAKAVGVLDRLVAHYGATNDTAAAIRAAIRLLALEPLREDIHRALMRCYAAQGRINLALKQYERCRDALRQELALSPEPETRQLYETLRARRTASPAGLSRPAATSGAEAIASHTTPPATYYVKSAGINIAYQVTGDGPIDLVYVPGWVSNLDLAWGSPRLSHVLRRLGTFSRLIRLDKRGTGLSDRNVGLPTLEERMEDVRAVLDAVGSRRAVLFGSSEGGPMCMLFAATYPERTAALVLNGTYASGRQSKEYPWGKTSQQVEDDIAAVERQWGEPADLSNAAPSLMNDPFEREWFAAYLRNSASPADAIALWRWGTEIDVRDILPAIHVPTLVVQRAGDRWVRPEEGRYLSAHIEGARYLELAGRDHLIWGEDCDRLVEEIEGFVTSTLAAAPAQRVLLSVLCVAIEGPPLSGGPGGRAKEELRSQVLLAEGRQISHGDNGFVAVFQRPTRSIHCAMAVRRRLGKAGIDVRAAIHTGECEESGDTFSGMAIELASRLMDHVPPGEIVVSRTVRDLVAGSGLTFEERGGMEANGLPGVLQLFSIAGQSDA